MSRQVTIITYHFVRDLAHSRYPEIKGLPLEHFREQVAYIKKYYQPIRMQGLLAALEDRDQPLPQNAALLTFDDGYIDHYANVFPILDEYKFQGVFFPPARAITEYRVLDVNKIHFILASVSDKSRVIDFIFKVLEGYREEFSLPDNETYYKTLAVANRFDGADVIFIKRILQRDLPEKVRSEIIDQLFRKYVTEDETAFSQELYMTVDQLRCLARNGMHVGSHGYNHYWLDTLEKQGQEKEIDLSLRFLREISGDSKDWVISYPYGSYNGSLASLLRERGCRAGFTTQVNIANMDGHDPLALPRLDTNDLPKEGNAVPNDWTLRVMGKA